MEHEQYFLFVIYKLIPKPPSDKDNKNYYPHTIKIIRAGMQKRAGEVGEGLLNKRVPIEFDPLAVQLVYAVVLRGSREDTVSIFEDIVHFVHITQDVKEAEEIKKEWENGKFKELFKKKERFISASIEPILVTEK